MDKRPSDTASAAQRADRNEVAGPEDGNSPGQVPRERQEWFRVTLASIGDAVIATDVRGHVTFMNEAAQKLTGFTGEEALGRPVATVFKIINEETRRPAEIPVSRVLTEGRVVGLANHTKLIARDGQEYAIADSAAPIRNDTGEIIGVIMVFQDVTARREAEEAVRKMAAEYEALFNGTSMPMFIVDGCPDGTFRYRRVNAASERTTGLTEAMIAGKNVREVIGEAAGADFEQYLSRCRDSRAAVSYFVEREMPKGRLSLHVTLTPVFYAAGACQIVASTQDITELVRVQRQLAVSEEKFRTLFEKANTGITLHPVTGAGELGKFIDVNDYMCRTFGYTREEFLAMTPAEIFAPGAGPDVPALKRALYDAGSTMFEMDGLTRDGRIIPAEVNAHVITLRGESVVMCLTQDITERRQAKAELEHRFRLERAVGKVGRILNTGREADYQALLAVLGEAVGVSRAYVYHFRDGHDYMDKTDEWCASGIPAKKAVTQGVAVRPMPWFSRRILLREPVVINDIELLPPEAAGEYSLYASLGVKALLCVPFAAGDGLPTGFLGFADTEKTREWLPEDVGLLQTVAEMVGAYTARLEDQNRIRYLSFHDKLTDLYNKAYCEEELKRLDTERQLPLSLIMGDVNGLKFVNDAFGHQAGDRLLAQAAQVLRENCRCEDIVARWGGDEFVVLLPQTDQATAAVVVERIRAACRSAAAEIVDINIALGTAAKTEPGQDIRRILKEAEDRMYRNKLLEGQSIRSSIIASLEKALWERSFESEAHARRMQNLALSFGRKLNLGSVQLEDLALLALLHDIGKVAIPDEILTRPGALTAEERETVQRHSEIGYRIAGASPELASVAYAILAHHEHWDGSGYPQGLAGEVIPLAARIVAIIDAFDVMTHDRPYRTALRQDEALAELRRCAGSQFDPELTERFIQLIRDGELTADCAAAAREL